MTDISFLQPASSESSLINRISIGIIAHIVSSIGDIEASMHGKYRHRGGGSYDASVKISLAATLNVGRSLSPICGINFNRLASSLKPATRPYIAEIVGNKAF